MAEEKRDDGVGDPFKLLLKESLMQQRNEMMDNFAQILRWLPTGDASSSSDHFGGTTPFKVQVNFDIPLFEGQIDVDVVDKWLNLLEGYFSVHNFFIEKRLPLRSLRMSPMSRSGGRLIVRIRTLRNMQYFRLHTLGILSGMILRNNNTLLEAMMTNIRDGPHCKGKWTGEY
jgi:hypothetical protein